MSTALLEEGTLELTITEVTPEVVTPCYVIYGPNQIEYPGLHVVRVHQIVNGLVIPEATPLALVHSLSEARDCIPNLTSCHYFERDPSDDPAIIECYIPKGFFQ